VGRPARDNVIVGLGVAGIDQGGERVVIRQLMYLTHLEATIRSNDGVQRVGGRGEAGDGIVPHHGLPVNRSDVVWEQEAAETEGILIERWRAV
jgi:hypothetical protein